MNDYINQEMTLLEEAIAHLDESLNDQSHDWGCEECKQEHVLLRGWLVELRERRTAVVIRCKDCKHYKPMECCQQQMMCYAGCLGLDRGPDFYCAWGEPKE